MKGLVVTILILLTAGSCINYDTLTVRGTVTDPSLENTKVYYVALDGPISRDVDSTTIIDGKFLFEKKADSLRIKILRIPIRNSGTIEDLVTVLEPGRLDAVLSTYSSGKGTRLNDRLQEWKEYKHEYDSTRSSLYELKAEEGLSSEKTDSIMKHLAEISQEYRIYIFSLMNENLYNGIGLLLFKVYYHELPPEEKRRILSLTGDLYPDNDAQLRNIIKNDLSLKNK